MARGGRRGHGGARQGTPGKTYSNRTDLMGGPNGNGYAPATGTTTPAAGGQTAPAPSPGPTQGPPRRRGKTVDDTPFLGDPTTRPYEPVTAGLDAPPVDPRLAETQKLKRWLPILQPMAERPDTPDSVRMLVRYINGS